QRLLHKVIREGNFSEVLKVLDKGVDIEARDAEGQTPLHVAARLGHERIVDVLLIKGAKAEARDTWGQWTALHHAVWGGGTGAVKRLLDHSVDKDAQDKEGQTPLHLGAMLGRIVEVIMLLESGANHDARDQKFFTPLHCAAAFGTVELAQVLLQRGADKTAKTKDGKTPLQIAESNKRHDVVQMFHRYGSKRSSQVNAASIQGTISQVEIMKRAENSVGKAYDEIAVREASGRIEKLELSLQEAQKKAVAEEKRRLGAEAKFVTESNKRKEAEARALDEEKKRKDAEARKRVLEKQMADAMHTASEGEQLRQEMENQLDSERSFRINAEKKVVELQRRLELVECQLHEAAHLRRMAEVKAKEEEEKRQKLETAFNEVEKTHKEYNMKVKADQEVLKGMTLKLEESENKRLELELKLKEEAERCRKMEAFNRQELKLRKEEEKMRREFQAKLQEEGKKRSLAELRSGDEAKKRARAEIKALAEEGKVHELEAKLGEMLARNKELERKLANAQDSLKKDLHGEIAGTVLGEERSENSQQRKDVEDAETVKEGERENRKTDPLGADVNGAAVAEELLSQETGVSPQHEELWRLRELVKVQERQLDESKEVIKTLMSAAEMGSSVRTSRASNDPISHARLSAAEPPAGSTSEADEEEESAKEPENQQQPFKSDVEVLRSENASLHSALQNLSAKILEHSDCKSMIEDLHAERKNLKEQLAHEKKLREGLSIEVKEAKRKKEEAEIKAAAMKECLAKVEVGGHPSTASPKDSPSKGPTMLEKLKMRTPRVFEIQHK
ncbi:unnamed protein product, partial [Closterium sp. NIES-65]